MTIERRSLIKATGVAMASAVGLSGGASAKPAASPPVTEMEGMACRPLVLSIPDDIEANAPFDVFLRRGSEECSRRDFDDMQSVALWVDGVQKATCKPEQFVPYMGARFMIAIPKTMDVTFVVESEAFGPYAATVTLGVTG